MMFKLKVMIYKYFIFGLMCLGLVFSNPVDDFLNCTKFKKAVYEETFQFGLHLDAPPIEIIYDHCKSYGPLIVGGELANPKEFPPMARLGVRKHNNEISWECGGTLIGEKYVLTAAHCFTDPEINIVRLGDLDYSSDLDDAMPKDYAISKIMQHEEYDGKTYYNDIALIKLAEEVIFDRYKHPACLPNDDENLHDFFIAAGWGKIGQTATSSNKLLKVKLEPFSQIKCEHVYESEYLPDGFNNDTQLCVGSSRSRDTCFGDSGGPLFAYHKDYQCMYTVMGITSNGPNESCGTPNVPALFTRVYNYLNWIKKNLSK